MELRSVGSVHDPVDHGSTIFCIHMAIILGLVFGIKVAESDESIIVMKRGRLGRVQQMFEGVAVGIVRFLGFESPLQSPPVNWKVLT